MKSISKRDLSMFENVKAFEGSQSSFTFSFALLPPDERHGMHSLYAFCSYIDDIVDEIPENTDEIIAEKQGRLKFWEETIDKIYRNKVDSKFINPFVKTIKRFNIPKQYFMTLITGCRRDLFQTRYVTFDDLKDYCYGVASIVGLISIEIFGHKYEETKNYAVNLGYALQITNIMRDVKADAERGYIYLPREDMKRFDYTEEELLNGIYNENFAELMRFQANRAREYYHLARKSLHPDEKLTIFSAEIMDAIYFRLLEKIELNDFDVFKERIRVSQLHKLMIVAKQLLSNKLFIRRLVKNSEKY
ncbi:MAG: squalene/phytoene synthase family protein [Candidatus Kapabacteria bacterium]|jgi:phytoene synthase|nr:squalene/phytoene synthase family protein [Candidatus Kapabacteria bacterium]